MTNETAPDKGYWRYLPGLILVPVLAILVLSWTSNSTELTPNHSDILVTTGLWVWVGAAALVLALVLWTKLPLKEPRALFVPLFAIFMGLLIAFMTAFALDRIWEAVDFSGKITRYQRQFPIDRAYVTHGKGGRFHIQLSEYFADLDLNQQDYEKLFGKSEELKPSGYCLQAPVEQSGSAIRIMYPSTRAIPSGRVVRCAPPPGTKTFEEVIADCGGASSTQLEPKLSAPRIINPDWLQKPSAQDISRTYPPRALQAPLSGRVVIQCVVGSDGWTHDCSVKQEAPSGHGFGAAALHLITSSRFIPRRVDCVPTDGGVVSVPVVFAG